MILRSSLILLLACFHAAGETQGRAPVEPESLPPPDGKVEAVEPVVEKTGEHTYRIGKVTFDQRTREIRFPARINMTEGLLEFLVVHENGKVHEALMITNISATHLNLAIKLLRYQASRELYALPNETGGLSGQFPDVPEATKAAARMTIEVERTQDGKTTRSHVNDWIQHAKTLKPMPRGPWVYGGSEIFDGKFVPDSTGDIIGIFVARSAMINYPGDGNTDDEIWVPYPKRAPEVGSEVTVILSPYQKSPQPKPSQPKKQP